MHWLLFAAFATGIAYFVFRTRPLDAFTIAFFSATIYFLPGFLGFTLSPVTPSSPVKLPVPVEPEAQAIMAFVLAAIVGAAMAWDAVSSQSRFPGWRLEPSGPAAGIALALGLLGLALTWVESGGQAFAADKREVIAVVGRSHIMWEMGASLAAALALVGGRRAVFVAAVLLLLVDMYIGFRFAFAITFVACVWLWISKEGALRLADLRLRYWAMVLIGGLAIFSYQNLKEPIRQNDWGEVGRRMSSPVWYFKGIMTSEPFTTQTVLNEVIAKDFRTRPDHLWSASQHLIVFAPALGAEAARFNDEFQAALFPSVDHGLANNIWAQMWSAGGWPLLCGFTLVFVIVLAAGSRVMTSPDPAIRAGAALFMAYWAFYIHRNELLVQVGLQKQVLGFWAVCVGGGIILAAAASASRLERGLRLGD